MKIEANINPNDNFSSISYSNSSSNKHYYMEITLLKYCIKWIYMMKWKTEIC